MNDRSERLVPPMTEGTKSKGGHNPPPTAEDLRNRPPAPGGSGGTTTESTGGLCRGVQQNGGPYEATQDKRHNDEWRVEDIVGDVLGCYETEDGRHELRFGEETAKDLAWLLNGARETRLRQEAGNGGQSDG